MQGWELVSAPFSAKVGCEAYVRIVLQVAEVGVWPLVTVESKHLGRQCNATVTADIGKARSFILCVKKHQ